MKVEFSSPRYIIRDKRKTHASSLLFSLVLSLSHSSRFNGPKFLEAFVVKGPSFLKKYTYFIGFPSLPNSDSHDIGKQHNNVFF